MPPCRELVGNDWKSLYRELMETAKPEEVEIDIDEIEMAHVGKLKEQAFQSIRKWCTRRGSKATKKALKQALKDCDLKYILDRIEEIETLRTECKK